jgi:hypothetical protein
MIKVTLKYPVTLEGAELKSISIRRPKARDLRDMESAGTDIEKSIAMIAALAGIPPDAVEDFDVFDFTAASVAVAKLMGE